MCIRDSPQNSTLTHTSAVWYNYGYLIPLTMWAVAMSLDVSRGSDNASRWQKKSRRHFWAVEMVCDRSWETAVWFSVSSAVSPVAFVWRSLGRHRVINIEHRRPSCLHQTVTDLELRLHNTVSNPHSRIESVLALQFSWHVLSRTTSSQCPLEAMPFLWTKLK